MSVLPLLEMRSYVLKQAGMVSWAALMREKSELRKSLFPSKLLGYVETGGLTNNAIHFYLYPGGLAQRERVRKAAAENAEWQDYLKQGRPFVDSASSFIYVEAKDLLNTHNLAGAAEWKAPVQQQEEEDEQGKLGGVVELRRYQLELGYDSVPRFLEHFGAGLGSKLAADPAARDALVSVMYSDVGPLNEVLEVWRHESVESMQQSRVASRGAAEWRRSIGAIAQLATSFDTRILNSEPWCTWS